MWGNRSPACAPNSIDRRWSSPEPHWAWESVSGDNGELDPTLTGVSLSLIMDAVTEPPPEVTTFVKVMEDHMPRVWRSLRYLGVPEFDLPDTCQEVFLVVHRRLGEFRGEACLSTWIYEICCRVAKAWRRRTAARRDAPMAETPVVAVDAQQESALEIARARHELSRLLDELPEEQRAVIVLHELEELPMHRVARLLGCPLFTAYSRLRLARKRLQRLLSERHSEVT
jgi:RNA polymerase sigma-70 factor (ECF subfamily)